MQQPSPAQAALHALQMKALVSAPTMRLKALQQPLAGPADTIQGVFHPVTTGHNAHLRDEDVWDVKIGNRIDNGTEIVADKATQKPEVKRFGRNQTWTKAVHVDGNAWDWNLHAGLTTFIRNSRLGADKQYPQPDHAATPPNRQAAPQLNWNEVTGEYTVIEPSVTHLGASIVKKGGAYQRLTGGNQFQPLDQEELLQVDGDDLHDHLFARVRTILMTAANGTPWQAEFAKDENVNKLAFNDKGSRAIRWEQGSRLHGDSFVNWYAWLQGPFARITTGAAFTVNAINHWADWLYPGHADQVLLQGIDFTGSDLHEEGLGAIFLDVTKPNGVGPAPYTGQTAFRTIFKSEDKALERGLFGDQAGSLGNRVNAMAGLDPNEMIRTFNIQTSQNFGSLIEVVRANQLDKGGRDRQPANSAMREALVFAFMTGLSDLHYENVLWDDQGMPYFIDADNALNNGRLNFSTHDGLRLQGGFTAFNKDETETILNRIEGDQAFNSKILASLRENDPQAVQPVLRAVAQTFAGKSGRVVPLFTQTWGDELKHLHIGRREGVQADNWQADSRWGVADGLSRRVETGGAGADPGLVGEAGTAAAGRVFAQATEKQQIKRDFDLGQIPFYVYDYGTGQVAHNGQTVWHGKPLAEALAVLFAKFPGQPQ